MMYVQNGTGVKFLGVILLIAYCSYLCIISSTKTTIVQKTARLHGQLSSTRSKDLLILKCMYVVSEVTFG